MKTGEEEAAAIMRFVRFYDEVRIDTRAAIFISLINSDSDNSL